MPLAIRVSGLSKEFHIGGKQEKYRTMRDVLAESFTAPFRRGYQILRGKASAAGDLHEAFMALEDVSFDVQQGEVVGIIGRNGAGKSTLLKILSRITEPSSGRAEVHGRVGALLEVGTGFHDELTGRENIFLNGAILGMARTEIEAKFDEIIAFAEVEKFIDTPVKHYSSGMRLRLGFAVAAYLEPEILIVDEVLAVGDAQFQKKCLGKMSDVASEGRTVLFVSHNMVAVQNLCQRAIWLDKGKKVAEGEANHIVSEYLRAGIASATEQVWNDPATAPGNDYIRLHRISVTAEDNPDATEFTVSTPLRIEIDYWNLRDGLPLNLNLHVYNEGQMAFDTGSIYDTNWHWKPFPKGLFRSVCRIPGDLLNDGAHTISLLAVRDTTQIIFQYDDLLVFEVNESAIRNTRTKYHGKWLGAVRPTLDWNTELLTAGEPQVLVPEHQKA